MMRKHPRILSIVFLVLSIAVIICCAAYLDQGKQTETPKPTQTVYQDPMPEETPWRLVIADLGLRMTDVVVEACAENNVRVPLALAIIEHECGFVLDAVNPKSGCYGPMQLNPKYFPEDLTPEENIRTGIAYMGELLQRYNGDEAHALTAYNYGPTSQTSSWFSDEIFVLADKWSAICDM